MDFQYLFIRYDKNPDALCEFQKLREVASVAVAQVFSDRIMRKQNEWDQLILRELPFLNQLTQTLLDDIAMVMDEISKQDSQLDELFTRLEQHVNLAEDSVNQENSVCDFERDICRMIVSIRDQELDSGENQVL
jgi:hypothetical protein